MICGFLSRVMLVYTIVLLLTRQLDANPSDLDIDNDRTVVKLRRELNAVAAAVDTIMRQYGRQAIDELSMAPQVGDLLPDGANIILLFWADDEAELFLNNTPISATRLTPTRVEIPEIYIRENNVLQAHCWDTDRVESGFMAGLYVEWPDGSLVPVITTQEELWNSGIGQEDQAQELFYTHSVPDIPEARVIWGDRLFGEVWVSASFTAAEVRAAGQRSPDMVLPVAWGQERPMDFNVVISRLVMLQRQRQNLLHELESHRVWVDPYLRFRGEHRSPIAYSLGRAETLFEEKASVLSSVRLVKWAEQLPDSDREMVLRPGRELQGLSSATTDQAFTVKQTGGKEDRRRDYLPPPDLGAQAGDRDKKRADIKRRIASYSSQDSLWLALIVLVTYVGVVWRFWWRLFHNIVSIPMLSRVRMKGL